ncbi:MAG: uridine kinase [Deltaproteobacteria bacterium]|nr:MAG: uridine kinase [Deltaproteobacteria bacterium]
MKPIVLGIAGGTASGKSTVAAAVAEHLGTDCLHLVHDRYYHCLPAHLVDTPTQHNFDHPDALDTALLVEHLDQLRRGEGAHVPSYDFAKHARNPHTDWMEPREIILVEGILVLSDSQLRARFDHSFYVHTDDDLRLIRRIRRDQRERGRELDEILRQYQLTVRPMHREFVEPSRAHAEIVLDGTARIDELVRTVLATIDRL